MASSFEKNPYRPVILPNSSLCCYVMVARSAHHDEDKWVEIGILSNHLSVEYSRWLGFNGRIRRAWRALAGHIQTDFEFIAKEELDEFIETVTAVGQEAFGAPAWTFQANATNTPFELKIPLGNAETVSE